jgi:hypothetical protein
MLALSLAASVLLGAGIRLMAERGIPFMTGDPMHWEWSPGSPLVLDGAFGLFLVFRRLRLTNRAVNFIARSTVGVYLIHEHPGMRILLWQRWFPFEGVYGSDHFLPASVLTPVTIFVCCVAVDLARRALFRAASHAVRGARRRLAPVASAAGKFGILLARHPQLFCLRTKTSNPMVDDHRWRRRTHGVRDTACARRMSLNSASETPSNVSALPRKGYAAYLIDGFTHQGTEKGGVLVCIRHGIALSERAHRLYGSIAFKVANVRTTKELHPYTQLTRAIRKVGRCVATFVTDYKILRPSTHISPHPKLESRAGSNH